MVKNLNPVSTVLSEKPDIDWVRCYSHLQVIEADFRKELFNSVFTKFFSKKASLVTIDDCLDAFADDVDSVGIDALGSPFYFFDKTGKVYYSSESISTNVNYILFDWKKLTTKDRNNMIYDKSARGKLIGEDK